MSRLHFTLSAALAISFAIACYRPQVVDCVVMCGASGACPAGMTCSSGLCTRGPTCVPEVGAGARHACAVRGGTVQCWGNNTYGQLGIGSTASQGGDASPVLPVRLAAGHVAMAVAGGGRHTCVIVADAAAQMPKSGAVQCWGDNSFGQLGISDGRARGASPGDGFDTVPLGDRTASAIAAGLTHTCALLDDATVTCWGDNRFGQLGVPRSGQGAAGPSPVSVADVKSLAAGAYHTCVLVGGGTVRCWGWNDYGQLGDISQPSGDTTPGLIVTVSLPGAQSATAIAAGGFHSCAILALGAVTCWGQNDAGQLGIPRMSSKLPETFSPGNFVDLGKGRTALLVAAGASHTCALLDDYSVKCWGLNVEGELGVGDAVNRGARQPPGNALPRVPLGPDPVSHLAAGANHTCAVQAAAVKCWGLGDSGQLGVGDTANQGDGMRPRIAAAKLGSSGP